jgi:2-succinyl-6-hydroxy-2,4-cyclohexadiene-1-carboxylate synthase
VTTNVPLAGAVTRRRRDRVVFLHGFTQTGTSWQAIGDRFRDRCDTEAPDLPGHGRSSDLRLDLPGAARWLAETAGRATYVGYSLGGRLALHLAVAHPELVERLVLVSTTAGIADSAERSARRAADEERARELERDGVAAFVERWLALPMFANLRNRPAEPSVGSSADRAQVAARLANTVDGLASSLRLAGTGTQDSLWSRLTELSMPVLIVAGALDAKFVAIAHQMNELIPNSELAIVADAGHVVHLARPDPFVTTLGDWLDRTNADAVPAAARRGLGDR